MGIPPHPEAGQGRPIFQQTHDKIDGNMPLDNVALDQRGVARIKRLRNAMLSLDQNELGISKLIYFYTKTLCPQVNHPIRAASSSRGLVNRDGGIGKGGPGMKLPQADARGILHFFGGIRRSTRFGCEGRALCELRRVHPAHSSMGLRTWSSAKADKQMPPQSGLGE